MSKKRSGRTGLKKTRNQLRKEEYAKLQGEKKVNKPSKGARKTGEHQRPCGNPACRSCYYRVLGVGIYPVGTKVA